MEMEQYAAMSEQLQNYSLWEQDYYTSEEMDNLSLGFSEANELSANFYGKNMAINPESHHRTLPNARNTYVVSSPETANPPAKSKRRRSKGAAAASQSTTFLNASISNFRAVVQQHTGCHSNTSSPKGPITLCFANATATAAQEAHHFNSRYY